MGVWKEREQKVAGLTSQVHVTWNCAARVRDAPWTLKKA